MAEQVMGHLRFRRAPVTVPTNRLWRHIPDVITVNWLHNRLKKVILKKRYCCHSLLSSWEGISGDCCQGLVLASELLSNPISNLDYPKIHL